MTEHEGAPVARNGDHSPLRTRRPRLRRPSPILSPTTAGIVPFQWDLPAGRGAPRRSPDPALDAAGSEYCVSATDSSSRVASPEGTLDPRTGHAGGEGSDVEGGSEITSTETIGRESARPHPSRPTPPAPAGPSTPAGASTVVAQNVHCWFGDRKVLDDVNLVMPGGQITALIGPSGCGKSTFLRSINRLHERIPGAALAGSILLDGVDIYGPGVATTQTRFHIGMVFQKPNPFPAMTIGQNVLAGLMLSGVRNGKRHERKRELAELLETSLRRAGLWNEVKDRLNTPGAALSGGQQQRLCIARALAIQPRVLLLDEPCSALDPISTQVIEDTMIRLKDEVTLVIVTHNMQQAVRVSDLCALFLVDEEGGAGHVVETGPTEKVFGRPEDPRTLDYVNGKFG